MLSNLWMVLKRVLWSLLFVFVIAPVFLTIWITVAAVGAIVDMIGELFGYSLINKGDLLMEPYDWFVQHVEYIIAGGDAPKALPYT